MVRLAMNGLNSAVDFASIRVHSPSPLNGERAGVRGEMLRLAMNTLNFVPILPPRRSPPLTLDFGL